MFHLAYGVEEVWATYYDLYKGSWYDWFEVVSTEPIEGTYGLHGHVIYLCFFPFMATQEWKRYPVLQVISRNGNSILTAVCANPYLWCYLLLITDFDCNICCWWFELSWKGRELLYCKCSIYILSLLEGMIPKISVVLVIFWFSFWRPSSHLVLLLGCETSVARQDEKEGSCFAWFWERWAPKG